MAGADINITSKELTGDGKLDISISGGLNTQTVSADFMRLDGVNAFGFADKSQPGADLGAYTFGNSLDPSKHSLQVNQSYYISGGREFTVGNNPLRFSSWPGTTRTSRITTKRCATQSPAERSRKT